ncbi:GntR family transcriptional regulator [Enterococcus sp. LJL120]
MPKSIESSVYQEIKQAILFGEYNLEEGLSEASISKKLGYSRSPIRSALKQLEQEKLIVYKKNRGISLREATVKEMVDITQICVEWLILATKQASLGLVVLNVEDIQEKLALAKHYRESLDYVQYINQMPKVYTAIMAASGNELLAPTYESLWARVVSTSLYRKMSDSSNAPKKTLSTVQFFQEYLDLIRAEHYAEAIDKLQDYLQYANQQILHYGRI